MIVDTPGVGESHDLDDTVYQYLPEAFAFIFVLTVANADGINNDTVSTLKAYNYTPNVNTLSWVQRLGKFAEVVAQNIMWSTAGLVSSPKAVNQPIPYQYPSERLFFLDWELRKRVEKRLAFLFPTRGRP